MPLQSTEISGIIAAGSVTGASGVAPIVGGQALYGCTTAGITLLANPGVYTIQLDPDVLTETHAMIVVTPKTAGSTAGNLTGDWTAAGLITVKTYDAAGALANVDFDFVVLRTGRS